MYVRIGRKKMPFNLFNATVPQRSLRFGKLAVRRYIKAQNSTAEKKIEVKVISLKKILPVYNMYLNATKIKKIHQRSNRTL